MNFSLKNLIVATTLAIVIGAIIWRFVADYVVTNTPIVWRYVDEDVIREMKNSTSVWVIDIYEPGYLMVVSPSFSIEDGKDVKDFRRFVVTNNVKFVKFSSDDDSDVGFELQNILRQSESSNDHFFSAVYVFNPVSRSVSDVDSVYITGKEVMLEVVKSKKDPMNDAGSKD